MSNKLFNGICAGVLAIGFSAQADADIVNISFTTSSGFNIQYNFDVQMTSFVEGGTTFYSSNETFLNAGVGGVIYSAADYTFQFSSSAATGLDTFFELTDNTGTVVSSIDFSGTANFINDGTVLNDMYFQMDYFTNGNIVTYTGLNYGFETGGLLDPNLYLATGTVPDSSPVYEFTQLNVSTSVSAVPVPAAVWLFGSGLIGLAGFARRKA